MESSTLEEIIYLFYLHTNYNHQLQHKCATSGSSNFDRTNFYNRQVLLHAVHTELSYANTE